MAFTPEEIAQILEEFFATVGTRQYIGARYVPIFGRKDEQSIEWDNTKPYEPLTIVLYQGNSFTSRQYVPIGVEITNNEFWAITGNYNAQVEQYRQEVLAFDTRITTNANNITAANGRIDNEVSARTNTDTALGTRIDGEVTARTNADTALGTRIDDEVTTRTNADTTLTNRLDTTDNNLSALQTAYNNKNKGILVLGDSYGQGYTPDGDVNPWINMFRQHVEQYGFTVYSNALGGAAFWRDDIAKRFYTLASALIETLTTTQKESIGTVIVGGGYNDRENSTSDINTGMTSLRDVINQNLPNVKRVLIFPFGMAVEGLTTGSHSTFTYTSIQNMVRNYVGENVNTRLGTVIGCSNMLLRKNSYFSSDFVHPNANGQLLIANFVSDVFFGNNESLLLARYNNNYQPNVVLNTGVTADAAGFSLYSENDCFIIRKPANKGQFTFATPVNFILDSTKLQVATLADAAVQKPANAIIPAVLVVRSSTSTPRRYTALNGYIGIDNGSMYLAGYKVNDAGSSFETIESVDNVQYVFLNNARIDGLYLL